MIEHQSPLERENRLAFYNKTLFSTLTLFFQLKFKHLILSISLKLKLSNEFKILTLYKLSNSSISQSSSFTRHRTIFESREPEIKNSSSNQIMSKIKSLCAPFHLAKERKKIISKF